MWSGRRVPESSGQTSLALESLRGLSNVEQSLRSKCGTDSGLSESLRSGEGGYQPHLSLNLTGSLNKQSKNFNQSV